MKPHRYIVKFIVGQEIEVYAMTREQAKILAQAERIKNCNNYEVMEIIMLD